MTSTEWPEFESTSTAKAPEWTLRTESELHVERLEAKLDSIKKKKNKVSRQTHHDESSTQLQEPIDVDEEEIQSGQEEADEGLWLLWNANPPTPPQSSSKSSSQPLLSSQVVSYGSSSTRGIPTTQSSNFDDDNDNGIQDEEREERLEIAKAKAKHAEEYMKKDSRTCCCIIS